jgi:hypothetical protein
MPGDDSAAPTAETAPQSADDGYRRALVFFAALLAVLASLLAYGYTLATGGDIRGPLAVNAAAATLLVALTARDAYTDQESAVTSIPGALGTALLLLAVYGLGASVAVASTVIWHGQVDIALWLGGAAAVAAVLGFFTFPAEVLSGDQAEEAEDESPAAPESSDRE